MAINYTEHDSKVGISSAPKPRGSKIANDPILSQYGVVCNFRSAGIFAQLEMSNFETRSVYLKVEKTFFRVFSCFILLLILTACHREQPKLVLPPPTVTVISVKPETIPAIFEYVGVVESSHLVEIRARVEGYLNMIDYIEGTLVHEGDLLFEIDPKPFEAALAQAKGVQAQQEAALWDAEQTVNRLRPLYEKNAASKRDLDNAIAQELGAKASVESAKAQVLQAELNLGYTTIRSPITGLSGQAKFREGALVGPGQNGLLTTVSAVDPIWVNFNVSSGEILKYENEEAKGLLSFPNGFNFDVQVILADGTVLPSEGKVDFADPSLKQSTGSMSVRAVLPNPKNILKPGQFVRARVIGATYPNAITVPQTSVMQGNKGLFVYVVDKDSKVSMRPVEVGDWYETNWIIDSGLIAGERVITDGVNKVVAGSTVIVKEVDSHGKKT